MRGQILNLDDKNRTGILLGDDGNRYEFTSAAWQAGRAPISGMYVDFVADGKSARDLYPIDNGHGPASDNSVTLGWLGIGCLVLSFVFPVLPTIAAFVLGLMGAGAAKRTGNSSGLMLSRIAWIGALVLALVVIAFIALGLSFAWVIFGSLFDEFRRNGPFYMAALTY